MTFLGFSGLVNFITCISIAIFVLLKNIKNPLNISFFNLNFSVALYSFGYFFWQLAKNESQALFWFKILVVGIILINITYLYFVFRFLGIIDRKRNLLRLCAVINFIFIILNLFSKLYTHLEPKYNLGFWPTPTIFFHIYLVFWFWQCLYGFYWLLKELRLSIGIKREQIKYFTISAILGFAGGATNWPGWYNIRFPPYLNITISFYIGIVAYAIFRYRLLDINIALTRAGIFTVVYSSVLIVPFIIAKYFQASLYGLFGNNWWFPIMFIGMILATAGPFIYTSLRRHAEDLILKDQRQYQKALIELSKAMARIRDLDKLYRTIVLTVVDKVKVSFAAIYLKDEEYNSYHLKHCFPKREIGRFPECLPLDYPLAKILMQQKRPLLAEEVGRTAKINLDSGLVIPCFIEEGLLGFLVLGAKPNNRMYTPDDILIFEALSYSTSLAIENCRFWREIEDRQRKARLQEMDTYSYSLAHEINNPMQTVKGVSAILKEEVLKDLPEGPKRQDIQHSFELVLEAADRVFGMVQAIRDFGAPITGEAKPVNIEEVVEGFLKLFIPQIKGKGISFEKALPQVNKPIYVRGEKPELMQVLAIFGDNAVHALIDAQEKKITLKVELPNPRWIRISFSDTGYGIRKERLSSIFAAFVTSKASTEGTGMGLYNAKKIVDRHKGRLWAESEGKGKGTTLIVELPVAKDVTEEELKKDEFKKKRLF